MKRVAFKMKLFKDKEAEYKRRHDAIWPELTQLLQEKGITEYSIFLDAETGSLFGFLKIPDPARIHELPAHPIMRKWWAYMKDIMECNPGDAPVSTSLEEVFYMP